MEVNNNFDEFFMDVNDDLNKTSDSDDGFDSSSPRHVKLKKLKKCVGKNTKRNIHSKAKKSSKLSKKPKPIAEFEDFINNNPSSASSPKKKKKDRVKKDDGAKKRERAKSTWEEKMNNFPEMRSETIAGVTMISGELHFVVDWDGDRWIVKAEDAYKRIPMTCLQYYESLLVWKTK